MREPAAEPLTVQRIPRSSAKSFADKPHHGPQDFYPAPGDVFLFKNKRPIGGIFGLDKVNKVIAAPAWIFPVINITTETIAAEMVLM